MSPIPKDLAVLDEFKFERKPVGVKFLATRPKGLKRPEKQLDFCEMLAEAQQGKPFYVTKDDFTCIGPLLLGMIDGEPLFESGQVGPKLGVFRDPRANRRIYQYLPRLAKNSVKYVAFAPLDKLTFEPDLLIILASVTQAEILIRAKSYSTGEMWSARGTAAAGCAWLYLYPLVSGEVNMTITGFGFGMRSRKLFPEGMVLMTIPWDKLPQIIKNLEEMEWVPESYTLGAEGHKKKVQRIVAELKKEE
ncbi:MAG: hypothetical protein A2Y90_04480 [Chloroflexi bacterium RBG_13_52_12]|nr:MAG: hypothetical protein A2Y90_04480 [Chloroflexi bacterium RBG_13_52_12]